MSIVLTAGLPQYVGNEPTLHSAMPLPLLNRRTSGGPELWSVALSVFYMQNGMQAGSSDVSLFLLGSVCFIA